MARLVWIGVGAVGGIYVYRKGGQVAEAVRAQGLGGTAQVVAGAAVTVLRSGQRAEVAEAAEAAPLPEPAGLRIGRFRISRADEPVAAPRPAAIMDTGVVDITDAALRPPRAGRAVPVQLRRKAR